jgi:choline dehydrogenase-like flavoprotein
MARKRKTLMSQEAYDIVIVGAGAAGCIVASYLAEHTDASIALIEAGDMNRDPFVHINRRLDHAEHHQRQYQRPDQRARAPRHGDAGRGSEADLEQSY